MAIAQKLAGYTPRPGRHPAPRDGQEEEGGAGQAVRRLLRGHAASAATPTGAIKTLWDIAAAVLRLRLQQGALGGVRPGVVLDRLPQGELPGRVHGRAAHLGARRQGQVGDLPQRVPPDEDPGAPARRQRVRLRLHPGRQRHPLRPHRDPQRRQQRRRRGRGRARGEGPLPGLQRLHGEGPRAGLQQAGHRVADQGRRVRRHEAPAPGAGRDPRERGRPVRRHQAQRGDRPGLPVRRARRRRRRLRDLGDHPRHRRVGQDDPARPRAGDARPLRLRPPAARSRARADQQPATAPSAS